jgi:8-oxo-dGTP diphosphatase
MTPRFGAPREAGRPYRRRRGVYAVLWREGRILLTHQSRPLPEFQLPGGGIDPGESPLRALHREVWEETGWRIAPLRRLGAFRRFTFMPEYDLWAEKLCTVYLARPLRALGAPAEAGHSAHWVRAGDAAAMVGNAGDAAFVRQALRKILA